MVCYFSGTGNSYRVARQIAQRCGDTLFSINQSLKAGTEESLHSEKPFVFVTPTYSWRMPRVVEQWMKKTTFTGSKNAYFVLTCGDECGNAAPFAKALCEKMNFTFLGLAEVVMPENYLAMFPTPTKEEAEKILAASVPRIEELASIIAQGEPFPVISPSLIDRLKSGPVNPLFYTFMVSDKGFTVGDRCIGCHLCEKRCPLNNITMVENKPHWNGNCTHCMACICGCPVQAIEYKKKSKGQPRYYIMENEKD